jgi:hypothetical protein
MNTSWESFLERVFIMDFYKKKIKNLFFGKFLNNFFSAMQKATSPKLHTHDGHDGKYVPANLQPSSTIFMASK